MQLERSRALAEKETLGKVYQQLLDEHRRLQTNYVRVFFNQRLLPLVVNMLGC
jgi:hypothetical protein